MSQEANYIHTLQSDPGNPVFADYGGLLITTERLDEAILVCMQGLSVNPECHKGRLTLAHALFRRGFIPFAAREIELMVEVFPGNGALRTLSERLSPGTNSNRGVTSESTEGETEVADIEFDTDILSDLDDKNE